MLRLALKCSSVAGALLLAGAVLAGCAPAPALEVNSRQAEGEIKRLEARLAERPREAADPALLRDLGTLYVLTDRPERGQALLTSSFEADPSSPKTRFYLGLASERTGRLDQALRLYQGFADVDDGSPYREAMRGRHDLVLRQLVRREAERDVTQCLVRRECAAASPTTVAVLPLRFQGGDERFAPLGLGLAELVSIDLSNVRALTVVERVRLQALLDEIERAQGDGFRTDVGPRTGRLLGAGQLVGGGFTVQGRGDLRLSTQLSSVGGSAQDLQSGSASINRLFELQKGIVFRVVDALDVELTPEERDAIQQVPTENLQAFLAFSRGLDAEDRGEFRLAAREFRRAREIDPGFRVAASREAQATTLSQASAGALPLPVTASLDLMSLRLSSMPSAGTLSMGSLRNPAGEWAGIEGTGLLQPLPLPPPPTSIGSSGN